MKGKVTVISLIKLAHRPAGGLYLSATFSRQLVGCLTFRCLFNFVGGIIQHHCTDTDINHAVQIVGYDFNGALSVFYTKY